jgi:hypothetical protein
MSEKKKKSAWQQHYEAEAHHFKAYRAAVQRAVMDAATRDEIRSLYEMYLDRKTEDIPYAR